MSRLPSDMWWSFGWDRPSTWVTSYTHRTSPSAYVLILWSRPWVYSAVRTGMKSTPCWPNGAICVLLEVFGPWLFIMVYVGTEREGPYWEYTSIPGGAWALVLWVPQEVWVGVVREPGLLRGEKGDRTVPVDRLGPGATLWPGVEEYIHYHRKPGLRATPPLFQGCSKPARYCMPVRQIHLFRRHLCGLCSNPWGMKSTPVQCRQIIPWLMSHRWRSWSSRSHRSMTYLHRPLTRSRVRDLLT